MVSEVTHESQETVLARIRSWPREAWYCLVRLDQEGYDEVLFGPDTAPECRKARDRVGHGIIARKDGLRLWPSARAEVELPPSPGRGPRDPYTIPCISCGATIVIDPRDRATLHFLCARCRGETDITGVGPVGERTDRCEDRKDEESSDRDGGLAERSSGATPVRTERRGTAGGSGRESSRERVAKTTGTATRKGERKTVRKNTLESKALHEPVGPDPSQTQRWTHERKQKFRGRVFIDYGRSKYLSQGVVCDIGNLAPGDIACVELAGGYGWFAVAWHWGSKTMLRIVRRGQEDASAEGLWLVPATTRCRPLKLRGRG